MKPPPPITSAQNSKIKLVQRLRSKRGRAAEARFVIDYERDLRRALQQGYRIDTLLYCPDSVDITAFPPSDAYALSPRLLERASYRQNPGGIIAIMRSKPPLGMAQLQQQTIRSALILVNLRVPGNIGALLRSADAAALDAVMLVDTALDIYNPNIIRSSAGACFRGHIYQLESEPLIAWLNAGGFQIVAADVTGRQSLYDVDFRQPCAIALGAEADGLDQRWRDAAHALAAIPMAGRLADSLNVSVSGALFMYERYRQSISQRAAISDF